MNKTVLYAVVARDGKGKEVGRVQLHASCWATAARWGRKLLRWNLGIDPVRVSCYKQKAVAA